MSVVGIDLSTRALDLVKLHDDTNQAEWVRVELERPEDKRLPEGIKPGWARTLRVRGSLFGGFAADTDTTWFDDVRLVAIEAPYGYGSDVLNRVVGAISASLPAHLRSPERCWVVRPDEWKKGLGLKAKPTPDDIERISGTRFPFTGSEYREPVSEHARDAFALAWWARAELERGVAA